MATSVQPFVRIGVGWAGSYVMTRAFARELPGGPSVGVFADMLNRLDLVASGELDLAWAYPITRVSWAYDGHRPWPDSPWSGEGLRNLRLVARFPRPDRELIALAPWSPVQDLAAVANHLNVRIAMRTDDLYEFESAIFQQYGYSLADIERAGGRYWHVSPGGDVLDAELAARTVDIVIGHASLSGSWKTLASQGFRFVGLHEPVVEALERLGFERHWVQPGFLPGVTEPLLTLDLADHPLVTRAEVDEDVIYEITKSIDLHKKEIRAAAPGQIEDVSRQWEMNGAPLHDGAARYYREAGYLSA